MKDEDRTDRIIEKVFNSLMSEGPTLEDVLDVWCFLGIFVFSENNKLSEVESMFKMSMFVSEGYREVIAKSININ